MAYKAVIEARKAAEATSKNVRDAVRLGLQLKRENEARKAARKQARAASAPPHTLPETDRS